MYNSKIWILSFLDNTIKNNFNFLLYAFKNLPNWAFIIFISEKIILSNCYIDVLLSLNLNFIVIYTTFYSTNFISYRLNSPSPTWFRFVSSSQNAKEVSRLTSGWLLSISCVRKQNEPEELASSPLPAFNSNAGILTIPPSILGQLLPIYKPSWAE